MTQFESDVPLEHAMLVWNRWENYGGAMIVRHPDVKNLGHAYARSTGACFANSGHPREGDDRDWPRMSTDARMKVLLAGAWQAVVRDGVSTIDMHNALQVIPEFRVLMTTDMLSAEYRESDGDDEGEDA
ncbi:hypothetical protein [Sphingomonas sp. UYP23]